MLWIIFLLTIVMQIVLPVVLIIVLWWKFSSDFDKRTTTLRIKSGATIFWFVVFSLNSCLICLSVYGSLLVVEGILMGVVFFLLSCLVFATCAVMLVTAAICMEGRKVAANFRTFDGAVILLCFQGGLVFYSFAVAGW